MSSIGTTCACPPPVPPPLMPKTGPNDGCRSVTTARGPILLSPIARPMEVVVLPSPNGVGLLAVTRIYRPRGLCLRRSSAERLILPLCLPYGCSSSGESPSRLAISWIGRGWYAFAMSRSLMARAEVRILGTDQRFSWYQQPAYQQPARQKNTRYA